MNFSKATADTKISPVALEVTNGSIVLKCRIIPHSIF